VRPGKRNRDWFGLSLGSKIGDGGGVQVGNEVLVFKIPDCNSLLGGSAQPISGWAEAQTVDDISSFEGIQVLSFIEIPQHGGSVSTSRCAQRTIRGDGNSVNVSSVSNEIGSQLARGQVPNLDDFIKSTRNNNWVLRRESDAADPFSVSLFLKSVFALSEGVPQLDGFVTRSRDNLSIVSGESNAQNILGVSDESSGGGSSI